MNHTVKDCGIRGVYIELFSSRIMCIEQLAEPYCRAKGVVIIPV